MRIPLWNTVFGLLFIVIVIKGTWWLVVTGKMPTTVSLGAFMLMALAIFRLIRLFTYDHITSFIRDWFTGCRPASCGGTLGTLLNCPWCIGLWFAFFVPFFYYATPYAYFPILILALAGVGSFFQIVSNLVGWYAEGKKHEVQGAGPHP